MSLLRSSRTENDMDDRKGGKTMTDGEQNMVNRLKMLVARIILDLDDEMVLEIIRKAVNKEANNE